MKICPKCNSTYKDNMYICSECSTTLIDANIDSGQLSEEFFAREEKKEKRRSFIHKMLVPLYYIIYIPFAVLCFLKERDVWFITLFMATFPLFYYLFVFKAEKMFFLEHMFKIDNIDDAKPSDWYMFTSKIGGYLWLILGIVLIIYLFFNIYDLIPPSGIVVDNGVVVTVVE